VVVAGRFSESPGQRVLSAGSNVSSSLNFGNQPLHRIGVMPPKMFRRARRSVVFPLCRRTDGSPDVQRATILRDFRLGPGSSGRTPRAAKRDGTFAGRLQERILRQTPRWCNVPLLLTTDWRVSLEPRLVVGRCRRRPPHRARLANMLAARGAARAASSPFGRSRRLERFKLSASCSGEPRHAALAASRSFFAYWDADDGPLTALSRSRGTVRSTAC